MPLPARRSNTHLQVCLFFPEIHPQTSSDGLQSTAERKIFLINLIIIKDKNYTSFLNLKQGNWESDL